MKHYVCGIDIGSSALKITLLAADGSTLGPFKREIITKFPKPSYAQQDPSQWYALLKECLQDAFETGLVDGAHIAAVAPDAATHTTVLLDENYSPVRDAIMWNDQRSAALAAACPIRDRVFQLTNHAPGAMWSLFQCMWVKENEPDVWKRTRYLLFPKDYLRFQLTGVYCTDHIDAEGTELYDVHTKSWAAELCAQLGFPVEQLPPIKKATDLAGILTAAAAEDLGLAAGIPVYVGTTDTVMEITAAGAVSLGQATVKLATSGRICVVTNRAFPHEQLVNYSHVVEGLWYPGTGTRSCATSLRWYKDHFAKAEAAEARAKGKSVYRILDEKAAGVPAGCEGLFFHPYLLGEFTPYSDENLRASFIGASMKHTEAHFIRAILEGAAYSLRDCMGVVEKLGMSITAEHLLLIGGGSVSSLWGQILADVLGRTIAVPAVSDSSFGSAMLAGVACGMFPDFYDAVSRCCRVTGVIEPNGENKACYDSLFPVYQQLVQVLAPVYKQLAEILR